MIALVVLASVVLVAALALAIWARRRFWGARLRGATASSAAPAGSVILAAASERGRYSEIVPLLADWIMRDMMIVETSGAHLSGSRGAASGPIWHFTAGARVTESDPIEQIVLAAMFGSLPHPGQRITIERENSAWREGLAAAVAHATRAQRTGFGEERPRAQGLRVLIVVAVVLAVPVLLLGAIFGGVDASVLALLIVAALAVAAVTVAIAVLPAKSDAERRYRQSIVDLREWVRTTPHPDPRLGGWAMIWNIPDPWPTVLPESVVSLRMMDRCFLRGDFGDTVPETFSLG
ncbi:hypothetical protein [Salinibacterium sp. ZJ70]|uniref:hypothetical protein n=1 Tax=Salinibacterium sp. ZJ70 TaxID=2708084 RepID=UPI001423A6F8|nr:hypothetical protein [Salinibacterium sp. ZJ70]